MIEFIYLIVYNKNILHTNTRFNIVYRVQRVCYLHNVSQECPNNIFPVYRSNTCNFQNWFESICQQTIHCFITSQVEQSCNGIGILFYNPKHTLFMAYIDTLHTLQGITMTNTQTESKKNRENTYCLYTMTSIQ